MGHVKLQIVRGDKASLLASLRGDVLPPQLHRHTLRSVPREEFLTLPDVFK